jgi:hypothetical protein
VGFSHHSEISIITAMAQLVFLRLLLSQAEMVSSDLCPQDTGRPRITSSFFQECTPPQCAQMNFCVFSLAVAHPFSSIVLPVSVSLDVEGQRTSKLLMLGPAFGFSRRGGSKKNRVPISKSINDACFGSVVWRHLHSYSITNCQANESLAHLPGDVRKNKMIVWERNTKHSPRKDGHDRALDRDRFLRIHQCLFMIFDF